MTSPDVVHDLTCPLCGQNTTIVVPKCVSLTEGDDGDVAKRMKFLTDLTLARYDLSREFHLLTCEAAIKQISSLTLLTGCMMLIGCGLSFGILLGVMTDK